MEKHVVIIGNGISGVTTARHLRKNSNCKITIISAEYPYFFSRTALMYVYMGHMKFEHTQPYEKDFWVRNKINLIHDCVEDIDVFARKLVLKGGGDLPYDKLVLALGSKPNKFGWPGQDLKGVQGLYTYQDLQALEENTKNGISRAVIVGGGLIGVEMAEMLRSRNFPVTFLVREDRFLGNVLPKEEGELIARHMKKHHVDLRFNTELKEITSDENGKVKSVITGNGEEIPCQLVGLTAGVSPNIAFLKNKNHGIALDRGVLVNQYLETSIDNIYALGDCAQFQVPTTGRKNIEQVWYTGRMMGECLGATLSGNKTAYCPGNWFNSAKFFDIEYQTYGSVFSELRAGEKDFYWEEKDAEMCLRLVFDAASEVFMGVNVFGMRLRHGVLDVWLKEKKTINYVLTHLSDANFDPEFYKKRENDILNHYNSVFNKNLKAKKKNWKRILKGTTL